MVEKLEKNIVQGNDVILDDEYFFPRSRITATMLRAWDAVALCGRSCIVQPLEEQMKKLLLVSLTLNACLVVSLIFRAGLATAQAANSTTACGDFNGDGDVNVADAVGLLNWLFGGGRDPMCRTGPLPATGQTKCFHTNGGEIGCQDTIHPDQDGTFQTGCPMEDRFVDNSDGTVTDMCTGLMWQKEKAVLPTQFDPDNNGEATWQHALQYCEQLVLLQNDTWGIDSDQIPANQMKHHDWRLPNVHELHSILDYGSGFEAGVFSGETDYYWTSTTYPTHPERAALVTFGSFFLGGSEWGPLTFDNKTNEFGQSVRAVRGPVTLD